MFIIEKMVKWKNRRPTFEFAEVANQRIPHLVIAYYEQRIRWKNGNKPLERAIVANQEVNDDMSEGMAHN